MRPSEERYIETQLREFDLINDQDDFEQIYQKCLEVYNHLPHPVEMWRLDMLIEQDVWDKRVVWRRRM